MRAISTRKSKQRLQWTFLAFAAAGALVGILVAVGEVPFFDGWIGSAFGGFLGFWVAVWREKKRSGPVTRKGNWHFLYMGCFVTFLALAGTFVLWVALARRALLRDLRSLQSRDIVAIEVTGRGPSGWRREIRNPGEIRRITEAMGKCRPFIVSGDMRMREYDLHLLLRDERISFRCVVWDTCPDWVVVERGVPGIPNSVHAFIPGLRAMDTHGGQWRPHLEPRKNQVP